MLLDQDIRPDSTSTRGKKSSNTRKGYTRTCRRACDGLREIEGTRLGRLSIKKSQRKAFNAYPLLADSHSAAKAEWTCIACRRVSCPARDP